MISVEHWAEVRRLNKSEGMAIKQIARRVGVARNTVRAARWPTTHEPPSGLRRGCSQLLDVDMDQGAGVGMFVAAYWFAVGPVDVGEAVVHIGPRRQRDGRAPTTRSLLGQIASR